MMNIKKIKIRPFEKGLKFYKGEFVKVVKPGEYWVIDPLGRTRIDVMSQRTPWIEHDDLDVIAYSGNFADHANVVEIDDKHYGFVWIDGKFERVLTKGVYAYWNGIRRVEVERVSIRTPWIVAKDLSIVIESGQLDGLATVVDLNDKQRAIVWVDGRFETILSPEVYAYWNDYRAVKVDIVDAREPQFEHNDIARIMTSAKAKAVLSELIVEEGRVGTVLLDGRLVKVLSPGKYAFWKDIANVKLMVTDMRDKTMDVAGQDIMTMDKVTLRMNAVVNYRIHDVEKSVKQVEDPDQALYREAQLALRAAVGANTLDALLENKALLGEELTEALSVKANALGLTLSGVGIRDIILPGEMKALMNKVTEAKKAAEANLIARREETAAMRSQANTAKLLENNPTLMRLKELEALATIAESSKLSVVLGEKGLADRVVNLL